MKYPELNEHAKNLENLYETFDWILRNYEVPHELELEVNTLLLKFKRLLKFNMSETFDDISLYAVVELHGEAQRVLEEIKITYNTYFIHSDLQDRVRSRTEQYAEKEPLPEKKEDYESLGGFSRSLGVF